MTGWLDPLRAALDSAERPVTFFFRDDKIVTVNGGPDDSNIIGAKYAREQCERMGWMFKPD